MSYLNKMRDTYYSMNQEINNMKKIKRLKTKLSNKRGNH